MRVKSLIATGATSGATFSPGILVQEVSVVVSGSVRGAAFDLVARLGRTGSRWQGLEDGSLNEADPVRHRLPVHSEKSVRVESWAYAGMVHRVGADGDRSDRDDHLGAWANLVAARTASL